MFKTFHLHYQEPSKVNRFYFWRVEEPDKSTTTESEI